MENSITIVTIILAAGSSSRLGTSKQLLTISEDTLLARTVKTSLMSDAAKTIVVLGANADTHTRAIHHLNVDIVINKNWEAGIGSSIKIGLQDALHKNPQLNAIIISVCDQPLLSSKHINALIAHYRASHSTVVASAYGGTIGVPVLFDRCHFSKLHALNDAHGAKKVIENIQGNLSAVSFDGGQIDIDTKEDYKRFIDGMSDKKIKPFS